MPSAFALQDERGVGKARASLLLGISELCRRALSEKTRERPLLNSPGAVEDFLRTQIDTRPTEVFVCLYLDTRHHQLLDIREETQGTLTRFAVYPREIVRPRCRSTRRG